MNKSMIIFGGSQFYREILVDGEYKISKKRTVNGLMQKYDIDNFSNDTLTTRTVLKTLEVFTSARKYSYCILALGEGDMKAGIEPYEFEKNMNLILEHLHANNIAPLLVSLPIKAQKRYNGAVFQAIIDELTKNYSTEYIYNGESTIYENNVGSDMEMKRTISRLCA